MQLKKGFTLVEVLIALAILGIVAASTIYVLVNVIPKEHEYLAKKPAVTLSNGVKTLLENDRIYPNKSFEGGQKFCYNYIKIFGEVQSSNCQQPSNISDSPFSSGDKIPQNIYAMANLTSSTGETWIGLNQHFKDEKTPIKILVDVNGPNKGKNILGEDVVLLSLYQNGKIGEFDERNTSVDQKTNKYIDCSKCKLEKTPVPNSCSAAYKGKTRLICKPYPQCSQDGPAFSCCPYILAHPDDYTWGPWTKSGRAIKDDLGNICIQPLCENNANLDYTIVIGDLNKSESSDASWIIGQANYAAHCKRWTGQDCCGTQTIPLSDLNLPYDAKIASCECTNIRALDYDNSRKDTGGHFECSCTPGGSGIKVKLCTRYLLGGTGDYDDWGVSSFRVKYSSSSCK